MPSFLCAGSLPGLVVSSHVLDLREGAIHLASSFPTAVHITVRDGPFHCASTVSDRLKSKGSISARNVRLDEGTHMYSTCVRQSAASALQLAWQVSGD